MLLARTILLGYVAATNLKHRWSLGRHFAVGDLWCVKCVLGGSRSPSYTLLWTREYDRESYDALIQSANT